MKHNNRYLKLTPKIFMNFKHNKLYSSQCVNATLRELEAYLKTCHSTKKRFLVSGWVYGNSLKKFLLFTLEITFAYLSKDKIYKIGLQFWLWFALRLGL